MQDKSLNIKGTNVKINNTINGLKIDNKFLSDIVGENMPKGMSNYTDYMADIDITIKIKGGDFIINHEGYTVEDINESKEDENNAIIPTNTEL